MVRKHGLSCPRPPGPPFDLLVSPWSVFSHGSPRKGELFISRSEIVRKPFFGGLFVMFMFFDFTGVRGDAVESGTGCSFAACGKDPLALGRNVAQRSQHNSTDLPAFRA